METHGHCVVLGRWRRADVSPPGGAEVAVSLPDAVSYTLHFSFHRTNTDPGSCARKTEVKYFLNIKTVKIHSLTDCSLLRVMMTMMKVTLIHHVGVMTTSDP